MSDYLVLLIVLAIGFPLLAGAVWLDARRRRRLEGDTEAPPRRGDADVDAHTPAYVTQSEIERMPLPGAGTRAGREHPGTRLDFGHALPDFATTGERAELTAVRVLMVDGEITSIRELLASITSATADSPLAIVASGFGPDVLATLQANRRALDAHLVAAAAPQRDLYELAAVVGGEVLTVADLKAGYVPTAALGRADTWTSNPNSTWVEVPKA